MLTENTFQCRWKNEKKFYGIDFFLLFSEFKHFNNYLAFFGFLEFYKLNENKEEMIKK